MHIAVIRVRSVAINANFKRRKYRIVLNSFIQDANVKWLKRWNHAKELLKCYLSTSMTLLLR